MVADRININFYSIRDVAIDENGAFFRYVDEISMPGTVINEDSQS